MPGTRRAWRARAKGAAIALLAKAYPPVPTGADAAAEQRMCVALAKTVHEALEMLAGKQVPFVGDYTAAAREKLMVSW